AQGHMDAQRHSGRLIAYGMFPMPGDDFRPSDSACAFNCINLLLPPVVTVVRDSGVETVLE
ncbi:unnamed protein product, partial [Symbiodinium sp. KB8]